MEEKDLTTKNEKIKYGKQTLIVLTLFLGAVLLGLAFSFFLVPKLSLNGEEEIKIGVNSKYVDAGAKAIFQGHKVNKDIKTESNVDTSKVGTYEVIYKIDKGLIEKEVKRTVIVQDIKGPVIELIGDDVVYVCENTEYKELGYKVYDDVDGDLSKKVITHIEDGKITYEVTDRSGNKALAERTIVKKELVKPTITLSGSSTVSMYQGNPYHEIGYKAYDDCGNDLTNKVVVTNKINNKVLGTYEVIYEVEDKEGHKASIKREVKVTEKPTGGVIYLTFDDGPSAKTTATILDILKKEGVKATFFVTNNGPDDLIKREHNEGHTVALHTASHNYAKVYASVDAYFEDLEKVHTRVYKLTGIDARIIRFPGGSSNTVSRNYQKGIMTTLTKEVEARGYHYFDWNIDSNDAGGAKTKEEVYQNVIKSLSRTRPNVVLMHDIKVPTRDALEDIITYGKENGYTFAALTMATKEVHHRVNN